MINSRLPFADAAGLPTRARSLALPEEEEEEDSTNADQTISTLRAFLCDFRNVILPEKEEQNLWV